jgi:hypothetical protein
MPESLARVLAVIVWQKQKRYAICITHAPFEAFQLMLLSRKGMWAMVAR